MIFNTKYANQKLVKSSFINYIMYYISSPIVYVGYKLNLTPNMLTTASIFFSILAVYFLKINSIFTFQATWFFSLILDYSDGPLARKTKIFSVRFNYDHLSDLFKISLLTASLAIFHNDFGGIILCYVFIFLLLFNEVISTSSLQKSTTSVPEPLISKYLKNKAPAKVILISQQIYNTIFIFHGHSLLFFLIMPISSLLFQIILLYYIFLMLKNCMLKFLK